MSGAPLQYLGGSGGGYCDTDAAIFIINGCTLVEQGVILCTESGEKSCE